MHWRSNHFVVTYKHKKWANLHFRSGAGYLKYTKKDFDEQWIASDSGNKGKVIVLEPTTIFYNNEKNVLKESKSLFMHKTYHKSFKCNADRDLTSGTITIYLSGHDRYWDPAPLYG